MKLKHLLRAIKVLHISTTINPQIKGISCDSREMHPSSLFVAVPGQQIDGSRFIAEALSRGAAAVVSENRMNLGRDVVHIQVSQARRALAELANAYFGDLSKSLKIIGVTGTNGKTTTCHMIRDLLRCGGSSPGLLGTVAYEMGERSIPASRTTPEAPDIHAMFRQMKEAGCNAAVMEVSSHALVQQRVHGIDFHINVFTNLTQDHLDYHQDMNAYFEAKAGLFRSMKAQCGHFAVINTDDPWGKKLVEEHSIQNDVVTYGFNKHVMVSASDVAMGKDGTRFQVSTPWGREKICLRLLGHFNIYNALAALATGGLCGIPLNRMAKTLNRIQVIPGRLEQISNRRGKQIFVDYAHTDDALKHVLTSLREICQSRLIVVFGCGGGRDRSKRSKMGRVAATLADYSVITSDNPRNEKPESIAEEIMEGFEEQERVEMVLDRREAIRAAVRQTGRRDVLLIAGKGHESFQELDGTIIPFDDREVVREALK